MYSIVKRRSIIGFKSMVYSSHCMQKKILLSDQVGIEYFPCSLAIGNWPTGTHMKEIHHSRHHLLFTFWNACAKVCVLRQCRSKLKQSQQTDHRTGSDHRTGNNSRPLFQWLTDQGSKNADRLIPSNAFPSNAGSTKMYVVPVLGSAEKLRNSDSAVFITLFKTF